ncbi:HNH endonuclease, partial [Arthrospira platensis SPKY2]
MNHRLLTSAGWQTMGDALGLIVDENHEVLAMTKDGELMCNGVVRNEALYTHKNWLDFQANQGFTVREIAEMCCVSEATIRLWAKRHNIQIVPGYKKGLKTIVGAGIYRDQDWLEERLKEGLYANQMAELAGCSVESIKKWIYKYGLNLNKRPQGSNKPWNKGKYGYHLNLSEDSRRQRQENAKKYTKKGEESNFWKGGVSTERELIGAWTRDIAPQVHEKFNYICQRCGTRGGVLHAHHLVPIFADQSRAYSFDNLVTLCKECHEYIHQQNQEAEFAKSYHPMLTVKDWKSKPKPTGRKLKAHPVKVTQIEYIGKQMTYDLEVDGPWHNFVANGIVVHNSYRYTGNQILELAENKKDLEDIFYLRPVGDYTDRQGKK